jgi:copper chaperone CopZ
MPTILLQVDGLHSSADEDRLERALRAEEGVYGAVASKADGCAEIDIDDDVVTVRHLIEVADSAGFQATLRG